MTLAPELVAAGHLAVREGLADSFSGWVSAALTDRAQRDGRLRAISEAVAEYEAEHGEITEEEMAKLERADRERAIVVRAAARGSAP